MNVLELKSEAGTRWDVVSLGEVMLRLDPGETRIHTARSFRVWEGGGEYNVARGLRRCFGLRAAMVTALADNAVGRLLEDLMLQGGVDTSLIRWVPYDGVGHEARNGLNFTERGFGPRAALGCSDRGHTATSKLAPGDLPWSRILAQAGARWLHTGGIFCALGEATPLVAMEAMTAARKAGTVVSYDFNFRKSLFARRDAREAQAMQSELLQQVDVLFGGEHDLAGVLGLDAGSPTAEGEKGRARAFERLCARVAERHPRLKYIATPLRTVLSASHNGWGGLCYDVPAQKCFEVPETNIQILDRVGGGDSFASGFIYGLMQGHEPLWALRCAVAHGALAMSTPGDTAMATLREVRCSMSGESARIER
jgi:2-dehydro-3-deoxygluconokinase